jgi:hypothetical protein
MSATITSSPLLRKALGLDALVSGGMGLLLTASAAPLSSLLGMPYAFLTGVGIACLVWAAFTGWASRRAEISSTLVWTIIVLNALWVLESALIVLLGWVQPTTFGMVFVAGQALAVFALTEAQFIGLRRSAAARLTPAQA